MLSLCLPFAKGEAQAAGDTFAPNAFVRIERDGQIVLTMPYVEMGQGTYTSIPMLIAEELEVDLKQVRLEHAPPDEKLYVKSPAGRPGDRQLECDPRRMAAVAPSRRDRTHSCSISAAAGRWNVDSATCRAQQGEVIHASTGRRLSYGELAADAARLPVPENVALKRPAGTSSSSARRPSASTRRRR